MVDDYLKSLWTKGCDFLGCEVAIMGGAMSWVSDHNLVGAISNAGGFGILACGSMGPKALDEEIFNIKALTNKTFGVNLIIMHPQLAELTDVCVSNQVSHVVLAGGAPKKVSIRSVQRGGAKVICFAPTLVMAKKLERSGVDALVIEGCEAGGHIGPVSTSVLAQEILPEIAETPVFVAGGIGRGEAIATYLEMGASGVQLGTRFVCATECIAHNNFKKAFLRAKARDARPTVQLDPNFPVIPVRALVNEGVREFARVQRDAIARVERGDIDLRAAQLEIEHFWAGSLRRAVIEGDVERGSLMAGQSVGMVKTEQPVADIIAELTGQAEVFLRKKHDRSITNGGFGAADESGRAVI